MKEFNVLVVDDEEEFRELTVKILGKRGLKAQGAESGEKALEILEHQPHGCGTARRENAGNGWDRDPAADPQPKSAWLR